MLSALNVSSVILTRNEIDTGGIFILQMRNLSHRDSKEIAQTCN